MGWERGRSIRNEINFTRSYASTDGCLVKSDTPIYSILAIESSPELPVTGPKSAVASDYLAGVNNRLPQGKALPTSSQGPKRGLRKVNGGEMERETLSKM